MSKLVQLKRVTNGAWGRSRRRPLESGGKAPSRRAIFCNFLGKNGYFNAIWITFRTFSEPFEKNFFEIWEPIEQIPPFTSSQVQNTFKIFHFGVEFCDLAWSGESRYIAFCNVFSIKSFIRRFAFEDFCFVLKITSFRSMYDQEPKHPRFNFNNLFNKHFPKLIFFKSILSRENWRDGGGLLFKVGRWWSWNLKLLQVGTLDAINGY